MISYLIQMLGLWILRLLRKNGFSFYSDKEEGSILSFWRSYGVCWGYPIMQCNDNWLVDTGPNLPFTRHGRLGKSLNLSKPIAPWCKMRLNYMASLFPNFSSSNILWLLYFCSILRDFLNNLTIIELHSCYRISL